MLLCVSPADHIERMTIDTLRYGQILASRADNKKKLGTRTATLAKRAKPAGPPAPPEMLAEIRSIYATHCPEKTAEEVETILTKFKGREAGLLTKAREKYAVVAEAEQMADQTLSAELVVAASVKLGEAPHWDSRREKLLWLDVKNAKVFEFDPKTNTNLEHDLSPHTEQVTTIVPSGTGGEVIIGTKDDVALFDLDDDTWAPEMHPSNGSLFGKEQGMNDGKCDPQGRLWIG